MATTQVAVRLDDDLLASLDWIVTRRSFANRAEALRDVLASATKIERDREIDERIRKAYERMPEDPSARIPTNWAALDGLDDEDWSKWR